MQPDIPPYRRLRPRLARRDAISDSAASISLSPGLVSLLDLPGKRGLSHQEVGSMGMTPQSAWNAAGAGLVASARTRTAVEFYARPAYVALGPDAPRGYEVRRKGASAAAWLAHPRAFSTLRTHFTAVMEPAGELVYFTRDCRELFVFDAAEEEVAAALGDTGVVRYSLGFPLLLTRDSAMV